MALHLTAGPVYARLGWQQDGIERDTDRDIEVVLMGAIFSPGDRLPHRRSDYGSPGRIIGAAAGGTIDALWGSPVGS